MVPGTIIDYMAQKDQEYRHAVAYPAAERREMIDRELHGMDPRAGRAPRRRIIIVWLGDLLIRAGRRLGGAAVLPIEDDAFGTTGMTTATRT